MTTPNTPNYQVHTFGAPEIKASYARFAPGIDAYVFIYGKKGRGRFTLDFNSFEITEGMGAIIRPGQVFRMDEVSPDAEGLTITLDKGSYPESVARKLELLYLSDSPFELLPSQQNELERIYRMADKRYLMEFESDVMILMAYTFAAILLEGLVARTNENFSERLEALPILVKLADEMDVNLVNTRLPSHYAQKMGYTIATLNAHFKKAMGENLSSYIRRVSMLRAARVIASTDLPISTIAEECGYSDPAYFTRLFTKIAGCTPSEFRKRMLR